MSFESLSLPHPNAPQTQSCLRVVGSEAGTNPVPKILKLTLGRPKIKSLAVRMGSGTSNGGIGKKNPHGIGENDGVIIVDHGSRRKESNLMLNEFVAMFKDKTGYPIVEPAHMDVVNDRINYCLSHVAGDVKECEVCVGTKKCKFTSQ